MAQKIRSHSDDAADQLGQTEKRSLPITGDDGSIFRADVVIGVNHSTDPHLARSLREGTLNEIASPTEEGRVYRPAVPVVYHDEERQLFALVIPEALRHREFQCRCELLERLAARRQPVPAYMRQFEVVFDPSVLDELPGRNASAPVRAKAPPASEEIEEARKQLEIDRKQLDEVADRVERDSERIDEAWTEIENERSELESMRNELEEQKRQLQVQELNLEQERLRIKNEGQPSGDKPHANEATQVVTDDQFIEVVDADAANGASADQVAAAQAMRSHPTTRTMNAYDSDTIADDFSALQSPDEQSFIESTNDLVVAGFKVSDERAKRFIDGRVQFLFQLHQVDAVPVIALTLASFDADGTCVDAVAVPLTDRDEEQRSILDDLARDLHLHLALYGSGGQKLASWEAGSPMRRNIGWARQTLRQWRDGAADVGRAQTAAAEVANGEVELVGSMDHPFDTQNFSDFQGASDVKLAVGIVGYWSQPEQFEYLIGNRAFPLGRFLEIQQRVVRQAIHWGIAPGQSLQEVAINEGIAADSTALVQRLLSNFAEVCVGLRANDLDPIEQWENWDALIALASEFGITPEPDVLELAEVSLNRAEEYEQTLADDEEWVGQEASTGDDKKTDQQRRAGELQVDTRHSSSLGIDYYWPAQGKEAEDRFEALAEADREALGQALQEGQGRLEAAQILLERYGAEVVEEVLDAAEAMPDREVAALARFAQDRADGLEGALMQALDTAGPSGTWMAARALASIGSTAAIPRLLDAARDPNRRGPGLARCLALFGDKLVPLLSRELKKSPEDEDLVTVLAALEVARNGTIDELSKHRHQALQKAARRARQMV